MPARIYKRPAAPVAVAGAPTPESIQLALWLLLFLSDAKGQKTAKVTLEAMQAAATANAQALESFGPARRIADLQAEAEQDRAKAAEELARAKANVQQMEQDAVGRIATQQEEAGAQRRQLDERQKALEVAEGELAEKQAAFERETAGLQRALAG